MTAFLNNTDWLMFYDAGADTMNIHIINGMLILTYTIDSSGEWKHMCDFSTIVSTNSYNVHFFYPSTSGTVFFVNSDYSNFGMVYSAELVEYDLSSTCITTPVGILPNPMDSTYFNPWTNSYDPVNQEFIYMTFFPDTIISVSVPELIVEHQVSVDSLFSESYAYSYDPSKRRVWTSGYNLTGGTEVFGEFSVATGTLRLIATFAPGLAVYENIGSGCAVWGSGDFFLVADPDAQTTGVIQFNINNPTQPLQELPLNNIVYQKIANLIGYIVCKN
jgi:hypothetical protein